MTKDLAEKMAQDYRKAIADSEDYVFREDYGDYLRGCCLHTGMCYLSEFSYGIDLDGCDWVDGLLDDGYYVYDTPGDKSSISEMVDCLQYRLNLLEKFIAGADTQH